jgi:hypothetical protein
MIMSQVRTFTHRFACCFLRHEHGAVCAPDARSAAPWAPSTVIGTGFACTFHGHGYGQYHNFFF